MNKMLRPSQPAQWPTQQASQYYQSDPQAYAQNQQYSVNGQNYHPSQPIPGQPTQHHLLIWGVIIFFTLLLVGSGTIIYLYNKTPSEPPYFIPTTEPTTPIVKTGLRVEQAVFASNVDTSGAYYTYTVQPNAEYEIGSYAYLYVKVKGFDSRLTNGKSEVHVVEDIKVLGPDGRTVRDLNLPAIAEYKETIQNLHEYVDFSAKIPLWNDLPQGRYTAVITLHDMIGGESVSEQYKFTLSQPDKSALIEQDFSKLTGEVTVQIKFFDPQGQEITALAQQKTVSSTNPLDYEPTIPHYFIAGEYSAQIIFTDADGNTETKTVTLEEKDELLIDNLDFASKVMTNYDYLQQAGAMYNAGDIIYIYFEVKDFEQDSAGKVAFVEDIVTTGPDGKIVDSLSADNLYSVDDEYSSTQAMFQVKNTLPTSTNYQKGEYTTTITITDRLSGQSTTKKGVFTLK